MRTLFAPEHGLEGTFDAGVRVPHSEHAGLPVFSLFGETKRPTPEMLHGIDTLVYDIQDVGARPYTYVSTLAEVLRAGAEHGLRVVVLDRPSPSDGVTVEGPVLEERFRSFVGAGPLALRYAMTIGEVARFLNVADRIGAELHVAPVDGWRRRWWYDETGLRWVAPSPNVRSLTAAALYPGTVLLEGTTLSEGRGTSMPFEWAGAPWLDGARWAERLNAFELHGVSFHAAEVTPSASKFAGVRCGGVRVAIIERPPFRAVLTALALIVTARELAPREFAFNERFDQLAGTDSLRRALADGRTPEQIAASWEDEHARFAAQRERVLLY